MVIEDFSLAAGLRCLPKNRVWGFEIENRTLVGGSSWLSSTTRQGCGYRCDGTTVVSTDQRYYASSYGRFNTPDPMQTGADPSRPGSWNAYAYVEGDPVGGTDPQGMSVVSCPGGSSPIGGGDSPLGGGDSSGCTGGGSIYVPGFGYSGQDCFWFPAACGFVEDGSNFGASGGTASAPECNPNGSSVQNSNLQFLINNYSSAQQLSQQFGVPTDWILSWVGLESSATSPGGNIFGALPQAQPGDNNFLGETGTGWAGQIPCAVTVTNSQAGTFACFASFSASVSAAFTSFGGKYLTALQSQMANGVASAFTALYAAGWDRSNAAYQGSSISSLLTHHVDPMLACLKANGYI